MRLISIDWVKIHEEAERTIYAVPYADGFVDGVEWFFVAVSHDGMSPIVFRFDPHAFDVRIDVCAGLVRALGP